MSISRLLAGGTAIVALAVPTLATAHAELRSTTPSAGANLAAPPTEVVVAFDGELVPDGSGFSVTDAAGIEVGGGELDLQVAERNELRGPVQVSEPGTYTVRWTSVAADGHVAAGSFTFGYRAEAEASPDTALPTSGSGRLVGVILLLLAAAMVAPRIRPRRLHGSLRR